MLGPTGHIDSFARDNLPPFEQWPEINHEIYDYPVYLNAGVEFTDRMVEKGFGDHTALIGNGAATPAHMDMAEALLSAVGETVRLESEAQMDAVTAVSGSGPAYVFHLIETLAAAGTAQGLPAELAMRLAKATVGGAGALALEAAEDPSQLRINVTSPAGTTAAALEVLMAPETGFPSLLTKAVKAAADRSKELGK